MKWTPDKIEWLLIGRDVLHLEFGQCAEQMNREYHPLHFSRQMCIGAYGRAHKSGITLSEQVRQEVKQCTSL
jgi:hypothetical protein